MKFPNNKTRYWLAGCVAAIAFTFLLLFLSSKRQELGSTVNSGSLPKPFQAFTENGVKKVSADKKPNSLILHALKKKEAITKDPQYLASVKTLGTREVKVNDSETFLFWNGEYISHPYIISRKGYSYSINGIEMAQFPVFPADYRKTLQKVPAYVTKKTSWEIIDNKEKSQERDWRKEIVGWYTTHYPPKEAKRRFVGYVKSLSFVKKVSWQSDIYGEYLHVISNSGDSRDFFSSWWNPATKSTTFAPVSDGFPMHGYHVPYSKERLNSIRKKLEERVVWAEKVIRSGDVWILNNQRTGPVHVKQSSLQWEYFSQAIEILKSEASLGIKVNEIYPRLMEGSNGINKNKERSSQWESLKYLVHNFKGHPQLDERIAALKKRYKIADWKQPPEPQAPKVPEKLKNDPRLTPEGAIKEALRLLEAKKYQEYIDNSRTPPKYGKRTVEKFLRNDFPNRLITAFKNVQNKKAVIDDIDDVGYFLIDAPEFKDEPLGTYFNKLPIRKVGHLWLIGY